MNPSVSVIVPCCNDGAWLDEAVGSVLAQTWQDFEILVVDDGSTDPGTLRILDGFDRPRTRVWREPHRGLAAARNFLVERATGTWLCALDADDRLHPRYFEKALAAVEADPGLAFVSAWIEAFGEESWVWRQDRTDLPALLAEDTVMTAALVRRDAVLTAGGYDERMPAQGDEDWDLWIRLVAAGHRGTVLPEVLFYYRRRLGSMSTRCVEGETHLALWRYLTEKHADLYRLHLREVLLLKARAIGGLLRENAAVERRLATRLEPDLERRRAELEELRGRLDRAERQAGIVDERDALARRVLALEAQLADLARRYGDLDAEYRRSRDEIDALRLSTSWTMGSPLRALYDRVRRRQDG